MIRPSSPEAVIVAACVQHYDEVEDAEQALKELGEAIEEAGLARAD
ncbi:hypothetical protein [Alkalilimnicola ehrlichii]|nr:hypothetical protein [Alkalilimnicola ehrlichii]